MKRLLQLFAALFLASGLAGCCYSPGYVDQGTGVMYGGGWEPCHVPNPFALFGSGCWGSPCGGWGVNNFQTPGCCDSCGTGPYGHYPTAVPTIGSPVYGTPEVWQGVPAGVYEESVPSQPSGPTVPMPVVPTPASAEPTTSAVPQTTIIYGRPAAFAPRQAIPVHDARASQWVPARL